MCFDKIQEKEIDNEIDNLLRLGVIKQVNFDKNQYISSIFTVPNKDTKEQRMILNLRELNKCITPHHFLIKMDTFEMVPTFTFFFSITYQKRIIYVTIMFVTILS
jgi:cation transport regulator ChaC